MQRSLSRIFSTFTAEVEAFIEEEVSRRIGRGKLSSARSMSYGGLSHQENDALAQLSELLDHSHGRKYFSPKQKVSCSNCGDDHDCLEVLKTLMFESENRDRLFRTHDELQALIDLVNRSGHSSVSATPSNTKRMAGLFTLLNKITKKHHIRQ